MIYLNKTLHPKDYRTAELSRFDHLMIHTAAAVPHHLDHPHRRWEYAMMLTALDQLLSPGVTILDIGGAGSLFSAMAAQLGYRMTVIDPDDRISLVHQQNQRLGLQIQVQQADFFTVDLKADAVLAISVLEHVQDDTAFLEHMLRSANQMIGLTVDFWDGERYSPDHLRTYNVARLLELRELINGTPGWQVVDQPQWTITDGAFVNQYTFASLVAVRSGDQVEPEKQRRVSRSVRSSGSRGGRPAVIMADDESLSHPSGG